MELHGDPWAKGHTLEPVKTTTAHSDNSYPLPAPLLAGPNMPASLDSQLPSSNTFGTSAFAPVPAPPTAVRPPMGRRASHDLFEAVEHNRFSEDQARYIFKQIGEWTALNVGAIADCASRCCVLSAQSADLSPGLERREHCHRLATKGEP
jgi:hypothetical protein